MAANRPALRRERIVDMAAELLETHGPDKLTLTLIANNLDVTQPALYNHVDGLDAVWRELGLREREVLLERLAAAAIGVSGGDAVRAIAHAWRRFAHELPHLYGIADRYPVAGDRELEAAVQRVIELLASSLRGFDLNDDQRMHGAVAVRSALHGFCGFEIGAGNPTHLPTDELFAHTVELLIVGVRALADGAIAGLQGEIS